MEKSTLNNRISHLAAQGAAMFKSAQENRADYEGLKKDLKEQQDIISNSTIIFFAFLFTVFCLAEIFFSWEIYKDMASNVSLSPSPLLVIIFALIFISMALLVSHLLEFKVSKLRTYAAKEKKKQDTRFEDYPISEIENDIIQQNKANFLWGYILFIVLIIVVGYFSYTREMMMSELVVEIAGYSTSAGRPVNYAYVLLPVLLISLEVYAGLYLLHGLQRISLYRKSKIKKIQLKKMVKVCRQLDARVYNCIKTLRENYTEIDMNRDVHEAQYRNKHRSSAYDDYLEPIPESYLNLVKSLSTPESQNK